MNELKMRKLGYTANDWTNVPYTQTRYRTWEKELHNGVVLKVDEEQNGEKTKFMFLVQESLPEELSLKGALHLMEIEQCFNREIEKLLRVDKW